MDQNGKNRLRHFIGQHLDISRTRMGERDVVTLVQFIDEYDRKYRGRSVTLPKTRET